MTLTELRYVVALAREKHFGRAAAACFVSQPTLSVAIRKLEAELGVTLFERSMQDVSVTAVGEQVVAQAQQVLSQVSAIKDMVVHGRDPLAGPLHIGVIYSIAPYLLPHLMSHMFKHYPQMPLIVQEEYTHHLIEWVKQGRLDAAILALPIAEAGLEVEPVYDESFFVTLPQAHPLAKKAQINSHELRKESLLVLGAGHCFRDHVLEATPDAPLYKVEEDGLQRNFEGSSLETLRYMAAAGIGITVLPALAVPKIQSEDYPLSYVPLVHGKKSDTHVPHRRVVLIWRKNFSREAACRALAQAVRDCDLSGVRMLNDRGEHRASMAACVASAAH